MNDTQKLISKLIDDYEALINYQKNKVSKWEQDIQKTSNELNALALAMEKVIDVPIARDAIQEKISSGLHYLETRKPFLSESKAEYDAVLAARKFFIEIIQDNCDHDYKLTGHNYHKNEEEYTCTICGKYS